MTYLEFCEKAAELIHKQSNKAGFTETSTETLLKIVQAYIHKYTPGHSSQYETKDLFSDLSLYDSVWQTTYKVTTPEVKVKKKKAKTKKKKVAAKKKRK